MSFESEKSKLDRDDGYRIGWKDGYDAGYDNAWQEMEMLKASEDECGDSDVSQFPADFQAIKVGKGAENSEKQIT